MRWTTATSYFNSRPRVGATGAGDLEIIHKLFQFTPPRGGDRGVVCEIIDKGLFQFTPPRGGDVFTAVYGLSGDISIHAPAWGRRHGLSNARSIKEFQFTPPRGGDA